MENEKDEISTHEQFAGYLYEIRHYIMERLSSGIPKTKLKEERKACKAINKLRDILDSITYITLPIYMNTISGSIYWGTEPEYITGKYDLETPKHKELLIEIGKESIRAKQNIKNEQIMKREDNFLKETSVEKLVQHLVDLMEEQHAFYKKNHWRRPSTFYYEIKEIRKELAIRFGKINNWKLTEKGFKMDEIARMEHIPNSIKFFTGDYVDHCYWYINHENRPAAVVAHLYTVPKDINQHALKNGLQVTFPNFPSWHVPNRSTLVLYTSIKREKEKK